MHDFRKNSVVAVLAVLVAVAVAAAAGGGGVCTHKWYNKEKINRIPQPLAIQKK